MLSLRRRTRRMKVMRRRIRVGLGGRFFGREGRRVFLMYMSD